MNIPRSAILITVLLISLCPPPVAAVGNQFDQAVAAIARSLPAGWTLAEQKQGEIPWGHHWNENYTGTNGVLLIVKGTRPVHAKFTAPDGTSKSIHVATEAVDIWLMPGSYSNSRFAWFSFERPVQPTTIVSQGAVKVYAEPTHLLLSEKKFKEILSQTNGISWVDSPADSPALLTWKNWRGDLRNALKKVTAIP